MTLFKGSHLGLLFIAFLPLACSYIHGGAFAGGFATARQTILTSSARVRHAKSLSLRSITCNMDLEALTVAQLREKLLDFGEKPASKLKKADLLAMLAPYGLTSPTSSGSASLTKLYPDQLNSMTVPQLKVRCAPERCNE